MRNCLLNSASLSAALAILSAFSAPAGASVVAGVDSDFGNPVTGVANTSVPSNLALSSNGSAAFANSVLYVAADPITMTPGFGFSQHQISHLNDGTYGNSNSWIGGTAQTVHVNPAYGGTTSDPGTKTLTTGFAGVTFNGAAALGETATITGFALSRDNLSNDNNGGPFQDRDNGTYYIQYTTSPLSATAVPSGTPTSPAGNDPSGDSDAIWTTIGSIVNTGAAGDQVVQNFTLTTPVTGATAFRVVVPDIGISESGTDIDEIQVFGAFVAPEPASLGLLGFAGLGLLRRRR